MVTVAFVSGSNRVECAAARMNLFTSLLHTRLNPAQRLLSVDMSAVVYLQLSPLMDLRIRLYVVWLLKSVINVH